MINKTDLAEAVGADLAVMERDTLRMRDGGPFVRLCSGWLIGWLKELAFFHRRTIALPLNYYDYSLLIYIF